MGMDSDFVTSLVVRNALVREGLRRIMVDHGFEIAQCVAHPLDFVPSNTRNKHIVVFDGSLLSASGPEEIGAILPTPSNVQLVLLKDLFDFDLMNRAFSAGFRAYILQDVPFETFLTMIKLVSLGEKVAPTELINVLQDMPSAHSRDARANIVRAFGLGDREKQILDCLVMGLPNKVIARELDVSEATVKVTIKGIFRKMSVSNRTQAAILARESGSSVTESSYLSVDARESETSFHIYDAPPALPQLGRLNGGRA